MTLDQRSHSFRCTVAKPLDATLEMRHWTCAVMANFFHTKHEPRHWTCAMMVNISHTKLELRENFLSLNM